MSQKLTVESLFNEAKNLSGHHDPVRLRNAGRSLCDAFKLFLSEIGGAIYGYDFVSNLGIKIRFKFLLQFLPELKSYSKLAGELDSLRQKTEHSDSYIPSKESIERLVQEAEPLLRRKASLIQKLNDAALLDLGAQKKLLRFLFSWIEADIGALKESYENFTGHKMPETETVKRAQELLSTQNKIAEMDVESISYHLELARNLIYEVGEALTELSEAMDEFRRA